MGSLVTASPAEAAAGPSSTRLTIRSRAWLVLGSGALARTLAWGVIEAGIITATAYQSVSVTSLRSSYEIATVYLRALDLLAVWLILSLAAFIAFFCEEARTGLVSFLVAQFIAFSLAAGVLSRYLPKGADWERVIGAISPYYFQTSLDAVWFLAGIVIVVFILGFMAVLAGSGVREGWPRAPLSPGWKIIPLGLAVDCLGLFWPISPSGSGSVVTGAGTVTALDNWSIPIIAVFVGLAILVQVLWLRKVPREIRAEYSAIPRMASVMVGGFAAISLLFAGSVYNYSMNSASRVVCVPIRAPPRACFTFFSPQYQAAANTFLAILLVLGFSLIPPASTLYATRRVKTRPRPKDQT